MDGGQTRTDGLYLGHYFTDSEYSRLNIRMLIAKKAQLELALAKSLSSYSLIQKTTSLPVFLSAIATRPRQLSL